MSKKLAESPPWAVDSGKSPLTIVEFGDRLLKTGDLDPIYTTLHSTSMGRDVLERLCLAYWCFYHLGVAAHIAERGATPRKFWTLMMEAAVNTTAADGTKPWPRGAERRHFRGQQAVAAMSELASRYKSATAAVAGFVGSGGPDTHRTYAGVAKAAQSHRGFGQWIAFKIADMTDRVLGLPVNFDDCHLGIYKDPRQGAAVGFVQMQPDDSDLRRQWGARPWEYPISDDELGQAVDHYVRLWRKKRAKAPPTGDRLVNVQEVETIFCKYKSHLKGHYPVGKDIREIRHGLDGWGELAQQLSKGLPKDAQA